jgi:hypothetical protein
MLADAMNWPEAISTLGLSAVAIFFYYMLYRRR